MRPLDTLIICRMASGRLVSGSHRPLGPVSIDTRTLASGDAFFCIRGPRFDGHSFVQQAIEKGARVIVGEPKGVARFSDGCLGADVAIITVPDTVRALGRVALAARARFPGPVVGLTGSSGKTTTKDFIAAVLATAGPTLATRGNLNNHLGVPLTLLRISAEHEFAVVEMGMNAPGEIAYLTEITRPNVGVITSVGAAHLEGLGSVEAVARAKGELMGALASGGVAIIPSDVPHSWILTGGLRAPLLTVGERPADDVRLVRGREAAGGAAGVIETDGDRYPLQLRLAGRHNLHNALLAVAVGHLLGVSPDAAVAAIEGVDPPRLRGELRRLPDGGEVMLDCYNANPQSMAAALQTFSDRAPGGLLILGDMLELGTGAAEAHAELGRVVAALPGDPVFIGVGPLCRHAVEAARAAGMPADRAVPRSMDAAGVVAERRQGGRPMLLKGSRGMALERIYEALAGEGS